MAGGHHGAFGQDTFGRRAEKVARFFGTPQYIVGQTIVVLAWIATGRAHPPLGFLSVHPAQPCVAAYAAPLILPAETRQADRDKDHEVLVERQSEEMERMHQRRIDSIKTETDKLTRLLEANTDLTLRTRTSPSRSLS